MFSFRKNEVRQEIFGMAAMSFLCSGILCNWCNLPMVNLVFTLKLSKVHFYDASFFIPYFNKKLYMLEIFLIGGNLTELCLYILQDFFDNNAKTLFYQKSYHSLQ